MIYSEKSPRVVVFGPRTFGGIEMNDIKEINLTDKVKIAMKHVIVSTSIDVICVIMLEWAHQTIGTSKPILATHIYFSFVLRHVKT